MSWQKSLTLFTLFLVFLCFPAAPFAGGNDNSLFSDLPVSLDLSIENERAKKDPTVLRSRSVEVNFDRLAGVEFPEGAEDIGLNLYDDIYFKAVKDRLEKRAGDSYTWFGNIEGAEYSQVILVVEDGVMAGNIRVNGKLFQVRYTTDGVYAIYEIDPSAFPEELPPVQLPYELDLAPETAPEAARDTGSIIDVMVLYTADVATEAGDIDAEIQLAFDETNQAYTNSGVTQRLRLVHSEQVTYTESGSTSIDLDRLQITSDGFLDGIHATRDTFGADFVSLWVASASPGNCGVGFVHAFSVPPFVRSTFEAFAFNVVLWTCATGNYTFGHELGHNMGAQHEWYRNNLVRPFTYAHGYVDLTNRFRTIMAGNHVCAANFFNCTRIQYFSNPDVTFSSAPTGVAEGTDTTCPTGDSGDMGCDADVRKTIDNTASFGANFRSSIPIPDVSTDSSSYITSSTQTMSVGISNPDTQITVDVYLAVLLPDGTSLLFVDYDIATGQSTFVPGTVDPGTWTPAASGLVLPPDFDLADFEILQYTFTGGEPVGTYFWFMALTNTGTTTLIGGVVSSSFTFTP
jgi:hypothetical protein